MNEEMVSILDGSTFVVSSPNGDIEARLDQPHGLFYKDTRHLSHWVLALNGIRLDVLSTDTIEYYFAQFFCVPPSGTIRTRLFLLSVDVLSGRASLSKWS